MLSKNISIILWIYVDVAFLILPYIIWEGTYQDHKGIILKEKELSKYEFDWYIKNIILHIEKMVEAK